MIKFLCRLNNATGDQPPYVTAQSIQSNFKLKQCTMASSTQDSFALMFLKTNNVSSSSPRLRFKKTKTKPFLCQNQGNKEVGARHLNSVNGRESSRSRWV